MTMEALGGIMDGVARQMVDHHRALAEVLLDTRALDLALQADVKRLQDCHW